MIVFLPEWLFFLIIGVGIIIAICKLTFMLLEWSILLSKITVSLVVALALQSSLPIGSGGLFSYIIWAAVSVAGFFLLCKLPRFDCAFEFFSKVMVALAIGMVLASFALDHLKLEANALWELITEIALKLTVLAASIFFTWQRFQEADFGKFSNVILVNVDRIMASILYTFAFGAVCVGHLFVDIPGWIGQVIILALPVILFLADLLFISRKNK